MEEMIERMQDIAEEMCFEYCRFAAEMEARPDWDDKDAEKLWKEHCARCPMISFSVEGDRDVC